MAKGNKPLVVFLGGRPGSGKGTVIKTCQENSGFKVLVVETGAMIRALLALDSPSGEQKAMIAKIKATPPGKLVADEIIYWLVDNYLSGYNIYDYDIIIFDGVPRTENQARWLERFLERKYELYVAVVFELILDRLTAIKRIAGRANEAGKAARKDDLDDDVVSGRQDDYEAEVGLTYLRFQGKCYVKIDATQSIEKVASNIDNVLTLLMNFRKLYSKK